jgi:hypothetical protein
MLLRSGSGVSNAARSGSQVPKSREFGLSECGFIAPSEIAPFGYAHPEQRETIALHVAVPASEYTWDRKGSICTPFLRPRLIAGVRRAVLILCKKYKVDSRYLCPPARIGVAIPRDKFLETFFQRCLRAVYASRVPSTISERTLHLILPYQYLTAVFSAP